MDSAWVVGRHNDMHIVTHNIHAASWGLFQTKGSLYQQLNKAGDARQSSSVDELKHNIANEHVQSTELYIT